MASLDRLLRGGSLVPDGAGGFRLKVDTKFKWDTAKIKRKVGEARVKSLKNVGLMLKGRARRQVSNRSPRKRPVQMRIGSRMGFELVALVDRVPKSDVVTSWKSPRFPKGQLRQALQSDYDFKRQTVVVGPESPPSTAKINKLLEFGGPSTRYFVGIPRRSRKNRIYGYLANRPPRTYRGRDAGYEAGVYSLGIRIRPRRFMEKAIKSAMSRIPLEFKDQIRGP